MFKLNVLLLIGGALHFGLLFAAALVPGTLRWREELKKLEPMSRHLIWVHGVFIFMTITGFGLLSVCLPGELAADTLLARVICGFIATFWLVRLGIQFFLFDARPHLTNWLLKTGYHCLTVVFLCLVLIYGASALVSR